MANDAISVACAPGVKIALPDPDWQQQADNQAAGDPWIAQSVDKHALGFGGRAYCDYIIHEMFYVNLYGEFIYFPKTIKREDVSYADWIDVSVLTQPNVVVNFGCDLTLDAESQFEMMLGGSRLGIELPITFTRSPELKHRGTEQPDPDSYLLSVSPDVSLFLSQFVVPLELKLGYTYPLIGKNADVRSVILFYLKAYLKFF